MGLLEDSQLYLSQVILLFSFEGHTVSLFEAVSIQCPLVGRQGQHGDHQNLIRTYPRLNCFAEMDLTGAIDGISLF